MAKDEGVCSPHLKPQLSQSRGGVHGSLALKYRGCLMCLFGRASAPHRAAPCSSALCYRCWLATPAARDSPVLSAACVFVVMLYVLLMVLMGRCSVFSCNIFLPEICKASAVFCCNSAASLTEVVLRQVHECVFWPAWAYISP